MQAYSMDLRERALLDSDAGMKAADVAVKYRVSGSWVRLLKQRRRETGDSRAVASSGTSGAGCWSRTCTPWPRSIAESNFGRTVAELKVALGTPAQSRRSVPLGVAPARRPTRARADPVDPAPDAVDRRAGLGDAVWHAAGRPGIRHAWLFSMNPASRTISCGGMVGPSAGPASTTTRRRPVAYQYVSRRAAGDWPDRARGLRRRHRRGELPRLYRTDPRAHPASRGHRHRRSSTATRAANTSVDFTDVLTEAHSHLDGRQGPLDGQRVPSGYGAHSSTNASTCPSLPPAPRPGVGSWMDFYAKLKALVRAARCRSTETLWPLLGACLPHFSPEVPQLLSTLRLSGHHTVMKSL